MQSNEPKVRLKSELSRTDSIVNVLMVYTINTGLLTRYVWQSSQPSSYLTPRSIFSLAVNITVWEFDSLLT